MTIPSHLSDDPAYGLGGWHVYEIPLQTMVEEGHPQEAIAQKCGLLLQMLKAHGLTKQIIAEIAAGATAMKQGSGEVYYSARFKGFITEQWSDLGDLIEQYGNDTAKWAYKVSSGEEDGFDNIEIQDDEIKRFLNDLTERDQSYKEAWDYLRFNVGIEKIGALLELNEEGIGNRSIPVEEEYLKREIGLYDIAYNLEQDGDDTLWSAAWRACETGQRYGAEAEMHKDLMRSLERTSDDVPGTLVTFKKDGWYHERSKRDPQGTIIKTDPHIFHVLGVEEILNVMAEGLGSDDNFIDPWVSDSGYGGRRREHGWIDLSEPHYGWSDFDEEAAHETFQSEIPPPPKPQPAPPPAARRRRKQP